MISGSAEGSGRQCHGSLSSSAQSSGAGLAVEALKTCLEPPAHLAPGSHGLRVICPPWLL